MPYIACIVATCKTRRKPNANKSEVLKCFSIPKDPILKKEWLNLCKVKDFDQARDSTRKVCIKHFKEDDFVDGLKARLLHLQPRILKKNAVPSLHLNGESDEEDNGNETEIRAQDEMLEKLMEETNKETKVQERIDDKKYSSKEYLSKLVPIAPKGPVIAPQGPTERRQYAKFLEQYDNAPKKPKLKDGLSEHYTKILHHDNGIYKNRISKLLYTQNQLKLRIKELKAKIKTDEDDFVSKVKETFAHVFTSNQIDMIMGKKAHAWWNEDEYTKAYTLQHLSKNAYFYVKDTLNYPLPAFSSLQQWAANLGAEICDSDDEEVTRPLPKRIKLTLDKISKQYYYNKKKKKYHTEQNESTSGGESIDNDSVSDIKEKPRDDYSDIGEDSDVTKISDGGDNIKGIEAISFVDVSENYENDSEMYEEIDYLDDGVEDANDEIHNNILDNDSDKNSDSDNNPVNDIGDNGDEIAEIDEHSVECYEELIIDDISKHYVLDNLIRDNSGVMEEDNG